MSARERTVMGNWSEGGSPRSDTFLSSAQLWKAEEEIRNLPQMEPLCPVTGDRTLHRVLKIIVPAWRTPTLSAGFQTFIKSKKLEDI